MSQAWIKIETITPDKIEVARVATALGMDRYAVLGRLIRIWGYFDQHSVDGHIPGIDAAFLDGLVGHPGFCAQVVAVRWMAMDEDGMTLPNFDRHNGETAKARALAARRQEKRRQRDKSHARGHAVALHGALPEERRGEEKREVVERAPAAKPTIDEVRTYCQERGNRVDPEAWFDHYTANGWRVGKNLMKDWRAAVRTWERNGLNDGNGKRTSGDVASEVLGFLKGGAA